MRKPVLPLLPPEPEPEFDEGRRRLLATLGGAIAAAGLAGCTRQPPEPILPFSEQVPLVPGRPLRYATTAWRRGGPVGLLVESWHGHPTKVEGNPRHPGSPGGATTAIDQAMPMSLYDPSRASQIAERGQPRTWRAFLAAQAGRLRALGDGERLRFLIEPESSPFHEHLRDRIRERFPRARFIAHDPSGSSAGEDGARVAFGAPRSIRLEPGNASVILSLDSDFLGSEGDTVRQAREFADRRTPGADMLRLYVAEARLSVTGSAADHRLAVPHSEITILARGLVRRIAAARPDSPIAALATGPEESAASAATSRWLDAAARDLQRAGARALVIAGDRQPREVHLVALAVNEILGGMGGTAVAAAPLHDDAVDTGPDALARLVEEIGAGGVDTLVVSAWNPAYSSPRDLDLGGRLADVPSSIYLGAHADETWRACSWTLPAAHTLEAWGDARSSDGTVSLLQPLIAPLFGGRQMASVFGAFLGGPELSPYERLREFWRARTRARDFEREWRSWVAAGVLPERIPLPPPARFRWDAVLDAIRRTGTREPEVSPVAGREPVLETVFVPDYSVEDGRHAGNEWLRELPDPVTKITWENAALLSPATADSLGLVNGDVVRLRRRERELDAPVWRVAGQAENTIVLPLGYGQKREPKSSDARGFDAYALRRSAAPWVDTEIAIEKTDRRHRLAVTQDHSTQDGRPLARQATLADFLAKGAALTEDQRGDVAAFYGLRSNDAQAGSPAAYRWAMAIDLNRCLGCNSCVIACQSENNVPVVGKNEVVKGREMHWLRIDRYVEGTPESPEWVHQPMACVHCETAPCEYVCPVNATVHSDEGLNEMVYNRCVGTRYCSNNCPYKVRRFNWAAYTKPVSETERMAWNPDVTVRSRGVMEKCTYCVQRIERARIDARLEGREIRNDEVVTACAQACSTKAIVFGSLHDPDAEVSKLHRDDRRYDVLHELGTKPRTAYLMRIRNPNPELA